MLWRVWLLAVLGATLLTTAWMFVERRLHVTTLFAAGLWSWCYVTTDGLELFKSGSTRAVDVGAFSWLILGFALLSFTAFAGSVLGFYPPEHEQELSEQSLNRSTTNSSRSR